MESSHNELIAYLQKKDVAGLVDGLLGEVGAARPADPLRIVYQGVHNRVREKALGLSAVVAGAFDLREASHHHVAQRIAEDLLELYSDASLLRAFEADHVASEASAGAHSAAFHLGVKLARSRLALSCRTRIPAHSLTVIVPIHSDSHLISPRVEHNQGQDVVRRKHAQLAWLYGEREDCDFRLVFADACYANSCGGAAAEVAAQLDNVEVFRSEPSEKIDSAPRGVALTDALHTTCARNTGGKPHYIAVTEASLSIDIAHCGLLISDLLLPEVLCVAGSPAAKHGVHCAQISDTSGAIQGSDRETTLFRAVETTLAGHLLLPLRHLAETGSSLILFRAETAKTLIPGLRDEGCHSQYATEVLMRLALANPSRAVVSSPLCSVASLHDIEMRRANPYKRSFVHISASLALYAKFKPHLTPYETHTDTLWGTFISSFDSTTHKTLVNALRTALEAEEGGEGGEEELLRPGVPAIRDLSLEQAKALVSVE